MNKKIKLIFGIIIFFLLFFVIYLVYNNYNKRVEIIINPEIIEHDEDYYKDSIPVYGADELQYRKALANQSLGDCEGLEGSKRNSCISAIAISAQKEEYCEEIEEDIIKQECFSFIIIQKAVLNDDETVCIELTDEDFKNICYNSVFKNNYNLKKCDKYENEMTLNLACLDNYYFNEAYKLINKEICNKISTEEIKDDCKKTVGGLPFDSDQDGLIDFLEMSYGTDPFNPDTDGDGFLDGAEIEKGYNPLEK